MMIYLDHKNKDIDMLVLFFRKKKKKIKNVGAFRIDCTGHNHYELGLAIQVSVSGRLNCQPIKGQS
jgi:hypothetical protein